MGLGRKETGGTIFDGVAGRTEGQGRWIAPSSLNLWPPKSICG